MRKPDKEEYKVILTLNRFGDPILKDAEEYPQWVRDAVIEFDKHIKAKFKETL